MKTIRVYCGVCGASPPHALFDCPEIERRARARLFALGVTIALVLALLGCPGNAGQPDAAPAPRGDCTAACQTLQKLQCPEGTAANCIEVCSHVLDAKFTSLDADCVAKQTTTSGVRACGVPCQGPP